MALEMNDLMMLKSLGGHEMTPYEQFKTQHMQSKEHTGGVAITGLVTGIVGTVAGVTAWIFGGMQASAKSKEAKEIALAVKELAIAKNDDLREIVRMNAQSIAGERTERIEGDKTLSISINDTVSGQQSGQLSASQVATNEATAQVMAGLMTGQYSQNPIRVVRVSGQRECGCDSCGCNG